MNVEHLETVFGHYLNLQTDGNLIESISKMPARVFRSLVYTRQTQIAGRAEPC